MPPPPPPQAQLNTRLTLGKDANFIPLHEEPTPQLLLLLMVMRIFLGAQVDGESVVDLSIDPPSRRSESV